MQDIAEEIAGEWLRFIKRCEFVEYNTRELEGKDKNQTEIDVIALNIHTKEIYICEVAAHVRGLNYGNKTQKKLSDKFNKAKIFTQKHYDNFTCHYMLWSPFVKPTPLQLVKDIKDYFLKEHNIELELVIGEYFRQKIEDLRQIAQKTKKDLRKFPVLRYLQIEEHLKTPRK